MRYTRYGLETILSKTEVLLFAESDGSSPLLKWLDGLPAKVQDKCIVRIERLSEMGHELRRPESDYLRDGIYELRSSFQRVHYRILYFFHDQRVVISHGLKKTGEVPSGEIGNAVRRKNLFKEDPSRYTYEE